MNSAIALEPVPVVEFSAAREPAPLPAPIKPRKPRVWTAFITLLAASVAGQIGTVVAAIAVDIGVNFVMGAQGADSATIQARVQEIFEHATFDPVVVAGSIPNQYGTCHAIRSLEIEGANKGVSWPPAPNGSCAQRPEACDLGRFCLVDRMGLRNRLQSV